MLKVIGVMSFLYFVSDEVGKNELMLMNELGPFITGTQVLRVALNASLVLQDVCFVWGTQAAKRSIDISSAIDLKPTIVSFLLIPSQGLSGFSLKFLRLESESELWVDSIVPFGGPLVSGNQGESLQIRWFTKKESTGKILGV
jgi:hypothetical protein